MSKFIGNHANNKVREEYVPNLCPQCNNPILPQPQIALSVTRNKKFCNQTCKARYYAYKTVGNLPPGDAGSKPRLALDRSSIRNHARRKARSLPKECQNCGYDKYVEVCHIKPVKDFPKEEIADVVNHIDNLLALCRNCHHEFDHGMLSLSQIQNKSYPLYGMFK